MPRPNALERIAAALERIAAVVEAAGGAPVRAGETHARVERARGPRLPRKPVPSTPPVPPEDREAVLKIARRMGLVVRGPR